MRLSPLLDDVRIEVMSCEFDRDAKPPHVQGLSLAGWMTLGCLRITSTELRPHRLMVPPGLAWFLGGAGVEALLRGVDRHFSLQGSRVLDVQVSTDGCTLALSQGQQAGLLTVFERGAYVLTLWNGPSVMVASTQSAPMAGDSAEEGLVEWIRRHLRSVQSLQREGEHGDPFRLTKPGEVVLAVEVVRAYLARLLARTERVTGVTMAFVAGLCTIAVVVGTLAGGAAAGGVLAVIPLSAAAVAGLAFSGSLDWPKTGLALSAVLSCMPWLESWGGSAVAPVVKLALVCLVVFILWAAVPYTRILTYRLLPWQLLVRGVAPPPVALPSDDT